MSHWECSGSISQEEFDAQIQPQLDAEARNTGMRVIQQWVNETGGHLNASEAEFYCSTFLDNPKLADLYPECMSRLTGVVGG